MVKNRFVAVFALLAALPVQALTFSVDPAASVDVVPRRDANGSVIVLVDRAATVAPGSSASPSAKNVTVSTDGKFSVVRCKAPCAGKVVVQVDRTATVTVASPVAAPPVVVPPVASDFDARKSAPGVVRWFDFDSASQLGPNVEASNYIERGFYPGHGTNAADPAIDTSMGASGGGSLKFTLNSQTQSDGAGGWFANFSPDLKTQFGASSEFYVQVRVRWDQAFHDTVFFDAQGSMQGGVKMFDVGAGDQVGWNGDAADASQRFDGAGQSYTNYFTNTDLEHVVNTYYQTRIVQMYAYSASGVFAPMNERVGGPDWKLQNAMPACLYSTSQTTGDVPGCVNVAPNEWMTLQLGITLGPKDASGFHFTASRVRLWVARQGQPSVLVNDWRATHDDGTPVGDYYPPYAGNPIYNKRFGKVNLFPYLTNKSATQVHPTGHMWFDELIISRQRIADPAN